MNEQTHPHERDQREPLTETAALRLQLGRSEKVGISFILSVALLAMMGPFSIDMIFPGFPSVAREFGASTAAMQQVTSAYLLSFGAMSIFHGPLSDALGRKRVMTGALVVYIIGALGAALSTSLTMLIAFRILQGLSAGGATIISRVVIRDLYGGGRAQKLMSQVMMIFAVAPAVAPIIGGWILLIGPWRWIFAAMVLYALITLVVMLVIIPETLPHDRRQPFHAGAIFRSIMDVSRSARIWRLSLALAAGSSAHFVYIGGAPVVVTELLHLGEQDFWVLFVPIISGMILGSFLVGRLADVISRTSLTWIAFGTSVTGAFINITINLLVPELAPQISPWHFVVTSGPFIMALGSALMMAPIQLEVLDLFPHQRGAATSFTTFLMLMASAAVTGLLVPLIAHSMLGIALGSASLSVLGALIWVLHRALENRGRPTSPVAA